jgi:hypothetical protein
VPLPVFAETRPLMRDLGQDRSLCVSAMAYRLLRGLRPVIHVNNYSWPAALRVSVIAHSDLSLVSCGQAVRRRPSVSLTSDTSPLLVSCVWVCSRPLLSRLLSDQAGLAGRVVTGELAFDD